MNIAVRSVRTPGLGDSSYVVSIGGVGIVVDPQRDIDRFLPIVEELDLEVRWVADTHLHNDYVSGARDLARHLGAELLLPAGAAPSYRHTPAFHGEDFGYHGVGIRPLHTPGHTPEHVAYLVLVDGSEEAVFTGGSLLVGSAGRSDLAGVDRAETLARLQYRSVTRLASLPDDTALYPTHGAGSFCSAGAAGADTSTVGVEKRVNPVLQHRDEDSFVMSHLADPVPYPNYYSAMGAANLHGLPPLDLTTGLRRIEEAEYADLAEDAVVVDARPRAQFAAGHLPGSLGVEGRDDFAVWVGWVTPHNTPLVLVVEPDQPVDGLRRQLGRIGYDTVVGVIDNLGSWEATELSAFPTRALPEFAAAVADGGQVLDVRAPAEWDDGTLPGSVQAYVPDLASSIPDDVDKGRPVLIACGTGYRATIAASILESQGYRPEVLVGAGVPEVLDTGRR